MLDGATCGAVDVQLMCGGCAVNVRLDRVSASDGATDTFLVWGGVVSLVESSRFFPDVRWQVVEVSFLIYEEVAVFFCNWV